MRRFLIALQFLTILPIKISEIEQDDYGGSLVYFPLIGALIGLLLALILFVFSNLGHLVIAALILVLSIIITGGIHLDGFADTCDGFYGARSKERVLEIMRDSHIGAMGVLGIFCLLLLKFTLLASLAHEALWKVLILMAMFSRWSQSLACLSCNYVRDEGKARFFIEYAHLREIIVGGLFTLALFLLLAKLRGLIQFSISVGVVFLFINYVRRRLGGMTGDTIGATNEIAEVCVLLSSL